MTWTDPDTRNTGDLITAQIYNDELIGNLEHLHDRQSTIWLYPNSKDFAEAGVFGIWPYDDLAAAQVLHFTWCVPDDFDAIVEAAIIGIADATETIQGDIYTEYGASGEVYNTHSESDLNQTLDVTQNCLYELDVSSALSGIAAGDYVTLKFYADTSVLYIVGMRFTYSRA
jgi:hypothetical protein